VYVFDAVPVFLTVNVSPWPPVFASRLDAIPSTGVTSTP